MAFDSNFNTILTPEQEKEIQKWKAIYAPHDSGEDYDLRGAFYAGETNQQEKGEHGSDKWKKPNHPTFSDQSIYAPYGKPGRWADPLPGQRQDPNDHGFYIPHNGLLGDQLQRDVAAMTPESVVVKPPPPLGRSLAERFPTRNVSIGPQTKILGNSLARLKY